MDGAERGRWGWIAGIAVAVAALLALTLASAGSDDDVRHGKTGRPAPGTGKEETRMNEEKHPAAGRAIFAGGCFWGVEHHFSKEPGVLRVTSGYTGGHVPSPTYEQVCSGTTGHLEAVEVVFDPEATSFETLARLFFEIHDPTQVGGQGPDIGEQYTSAVFVLDEEQRRVAEELIALLRARGLDVVTEIREAGTFWPAEAYHQDYYARKGTAPYCHVRTKRF